MNDGTLQGTLHGSSGATILYGVSSVRKRGDHRVIEQARWIVKHNWERALPMLPYVITISDDSYVMEKLTPVPSWMYGESMAHAAIITLSELWQQPAEVTFSRVAHLHKLVMLFPEQPDVVLAFHEALSRIDMPSLIAGLSHGDPTFENTMMRNGSLVFIDPVPATPAVPDLLSVDVGKMMQSAVGWEDIRYNGARLPRLDHLEWFREPLGQNEYKAATYWCAVHLARTLPYIPGDLRDTVTRAALAVLDRV